MFPSVVSKSFFIPTEDIYATLDTSTPPGAYHLLNFASSIGFKSENGGNYKINLRIENLLNHHYKQFCSDPGGPLESSSMSQESIWSK